MSSQYARGMELNLLKDIPFHDLLYGSNHYKSRIFTIGSLDIESQGSNWSFRKDDMKSLVSCVYVIWSLL